MNKKIKLSLLIKRYFASEKILEDKEMFSLNKMKYNIKYCDHEMPEGISDICAKMKKAAEEDPSSLPQIIMKYKDHIKSCPECAEIAEATKAWDESKDD